MIDVCKQICEDLESSDRHPKIDALKQLEIFCADPDNSSTMVLSTFDKCYLHMLKCYTDRYESVREAAARTVSCYIQKLPPNDFHLLNIVAALTDRMGKAETMEESEEMRLVFMTQLNALVQYYLQTGNARSLCECLPDVVRILTKAILDKFPHVQREACACVVNLSLGCDTYVFQTSANVLTNPLYTMLNHKHSQARISAVQALSRLALHVNPSADTLSRLLMEVSPLLMDSMPLVRRECGMMGVLMLMDLKDRYSYFDRVIPLVLCCLKDEAADVCDHIYPLWVKCGKQYYDENETELSKKELVDLPAANYPVGVQRPTIGCRALVQRSLRLLKLITRESSDWKENVRLHSLKLLYQFILHAEAAMTAKFFEIYADVAHACRDNDALVANEALKVADLMGRLLAYDDWYEHGFHGLAKNAKLGHLKCFFNMFTSTAAAKRSDILSVSQLLIQPEFSQSLKPEFQVYVIMLVQTLLDKTKTLEDVAESIKELSLNDCENNVNLYCNLYVATIKVMSLSLVNDSAHSSNLQIQGNEVLAEIACAENITTSMLHEKYFTHALEYVRNLDVALESLSEPVLLLNGLLSICKFRSAYVKQLEFTLDKVWHNWADDAKVKIFSAVSIVMLCWHETVGLAVEESSHLLLKFVQSVVEPHLVWKVGANAQAMRSLATATLCALAQGAPEEALSVLPSLAKYFPSLIEDQSVATRHYAIKCLHNFGEVKFDDLKPIAYSTLQRLDDPSADIREQAALVIGKLKPNFENDADVKDADVTNVQSTENDNHTDNLEKQINPDHEFWQRFICKALELLLLHLDCPEIRVQTAIKVTLVELANKHTEDFRDYFVRANALSYNNECLLELLKELPFEI